MLNSELEINLNYELTKSAQIAENIISCCCDISQILDKLDSQKVCSDLLQDVDVSKDADESKISKFKEFNLKSKTSLFSVVEKATVSKDNTSWIPYVANARYIKSSTYLERLRRLHSTTQMQSDASL